MHFTREGIEGQRQKWVYLSLLHVGLPYSHPCRRSGEGTLRLGIVSCSVGPLPSYTSGLPGSYLKPRPILYPELAPSVQSEVTGGGVGRHTPGKVPWQKRWGPGWGQPWGLNYPLTSGKALLASCPA